MVEDTKRTQGRRMLDKTFGVAPDFPYPDRDDWDRFDNDLNPIDRPIPSPDVEQPEG